jgi:Predicted GTPases
MQDTPKANRLHIALFGRRNAGKSSLINSITGQDIALVSEFLGTTTDPVYKAMELPPIGPVVIIDTAGLDDTGTLGELRIKKTKEVMDKTDLAILVFTQENLDLTLEKNWYSKLKECKIPTIGVLNKIDNDRIDIDETLKLLKNNFPYLL